MAAAASQEIKSSEGPCQPPFNMSDWGGENLRQDVRWKFGMPPVNNANYAWIQHFFHHLSPVGVAGLCLGQRLHVHADISRLIFTSIVPAPNAKAWKGCWESEESGEPAIFLFGRGRDEE